MRGQSSIRSPDRYQDKVYTDFEQILAGNFLNFCILTIPDSRSNIGQVFRALQSGKLMDSHQKLETKTSRKDARTAGVNPSTRKYIATRADDISATHFASQLSHLRLPSCRLCLPFLVEAHGEIVLSSYYSTVMIITTIVRMHHKVNNTSIAPSIK
jgi:hypothetical protein